MSLNLQNIITESTIDNLKISKLDKVTLKVFNLIKDDKVYFTVSGKEFDMTDGIILLKASEMLKIKDYNYLYSVYQYYLEYGDTLFMVVPETIPKLTIPNDELMGPALLSYYYKNYNRKVVFENQYGEFISSVISGNLEEAILEEMWSVELYNTKENTSPTNSAIFCNMFPPKKQPNKLGWDYLSMDDDLSEYVAQYNNMEVEYEETIDTGYFDIEFPKDLSDSSLKKYFEDIIQQLIEKVIQPNDNLFHDYLEK